MTNFDEVVINEHNICNSDLETFYDYVTDVTIIHSMTNWHEFGEMSSNLFMNPEEFSKVELTFLKSLVMGTLKLANHQGDVPKQRVLLNFV